MCCIKLYWFYLRHLHFIKKFGDLKKNVVYIIGRKKPWAFGLR